MVMFTGHSGNVDGSTLLLLTGRMVILTSDDDKYWSVNIAIMTSYNGKVD